ncbi:MAG: Glu-tRNA(Gln) amidotransferase subunit GatE [Candidatus Hodarchaeota archaeon]
MTIDYFKKLGFKAGLEIHQELKTDTKLFCRCPCYLKKTSPDFQIKRYFRPVMGEMGDFDAAMLVEYEKQHTIIYEGYQDVVCTYDIDETPPFPPSEEVIDIGLQIALLLNASVIDELHVCRKNYLDGSVPGGFQRSFIIGTNGYFPLNNKRIRIKLIGIEEDAARKIKQEGKTVYYRLDRLGIPLVEVATEPDLNSPRELYEAASRIGLLLRSTGKVKRGLGTIRQDVNISIKDGARVELKGVQKLDLIPKLAENEVKRQLALVEIKNELKARKVAPGDLKYNFIDITHIFRNTRCQIIRKGMDSGGKVFAVNIQNLSGLLKKEIQPNKTFGRELAEKVMVMTKVKGLIHSDEDLREYGFSKDEVLNIRKSLKTAKNDSFAIVVAKPAIAKRVLKLIVDRCKQALKGVPQETRRALENGNSEFERVLAGSARLYPDTDTPPIVIKEEKTVKIRKHLPEYPWDLEERLAEKYSIEPMTIRELFLSDRIELFSRIVDELHIEAVLASTTLLQMIKALEREKLDVENLTDNTIIDVFRLLADGKIAKEAIEDLFRILSKDPELSAQEAANKLGIEAITSKQLDKLIDELLTKSKGLIEEKGERAFAPLMGELMKQVRGKIDGKQVASTLRRKMKVVITHGK